MSLNLSKMKSIIELSKILDVKPNDLNRMFVAREIPVVVDFGINDGFIQSEVFDLIVRSYEDRMSLIVPISEITANKKDCIPIKQLPYLYFLFYFDELIYIGQSNNLTLRISEHKKSGKDFNFVSAFEVDQRKLYDIEQINIFTYKPPLNIAGLDKNTIISSIIKAV